MDIFFYFLLTIFVIKEKKNEEMDVTNKFRIHKIIIYFAFMVEMSHNK